MANINNTRIVLPLSFATLGVEYTRKRAVLMMNRPSAISNIHPTQVKSGNNKEIKHSNNVTMIKLLIATPRLS